MGVDKAGLRLGGKTLLQRTLNELRDYPTTILGPGGVLDADPGAGPLAALAAFLPQADGVFVVACDVPLFDGRLVELLLAQAGAAEAVVPVVKDRLQPLCGLYRASAFTRLQAIHASGERRLMSWLEALNLRSVNEAELAAAGLNPLCPLSANTPEEWRELLIAGGIVE
ncbi:MAG: Molybdenum cofactor guanylyltransferase [Fimbriimonadaceae bacterium]|nr:Molybdenum cofactor guanylyltransferase [Fimbriimonadaceae bacterium]